MNDMRRNIKRIFWLYFLIFMSTILFLIKIVWIDSPTMITNPYNPRLHGLEKDVIRGDIRDIHGEIIAKTEKIDGAYRRVYPFDREFAHIVGYAAKGKAGIEASVNFSLLHTSYEIFQRIRQVWKNQDLEGNHVVLTLDQELQSLVYAALGNRKGAVVVMEPSTGKILSMVSYPDFDPNEVGTGWEELKADEENSPLLNRATQGMYPPGSIFKIITATAILETDPAWEAFSYICEGQDVFDENRIRCFNSQAHGALSLQEAFTVSCNTTFAYLGRELGPLKLKEIAEQLYFNHVLPYSLEYRSSQFALTKESTTQEVVETAIGQGKTLVSPLHMALLVSAIANGGTLMKPYAVDHMVNLRGSTIDKTLPKKEAVLFSPETAEILTQMMEEVVQNGTGKGAAISGVSVAGKTGTAETSAGAPHAWFVGFAPSQKPQVAVAIVLENAGVGGVEAAPIAKRIFEKILSK